MQRRNDTGNESTGIRYTDCTGMEARQPQPQALTQDSPGEATSLPSDNDHDEDELPDQTNGQEQRPSRPVNTRRAVDAIIQQWIRNPAQHSHR